VRIAVAGLLWLIMTQSTAAQNRAADESTVRDLVARYMDAREKRDGRALEALFTEDADQVTTGGEWRRGRQNLVRGAQASSCALVSIAASASSRPIVTHADFPDLQADQQKERPCQRRKALDQD
jgi:hypothetical protein